MGDPGPEMIGSVPAAGPAAREPAAEENEDDIQFVGEGLSRPVLEYIDLVCGGNEEPHIHHSDILFPKMPKREGECLHFLNVKKVKTGTESNNRNKNHWIVLSQRNPVTSMLIQQSLKKGHCGQQINR